MIWHRWQHRCLFIENQCSAVLRVRERLDYKNSSLIFVLPYKTAKFRNNESSFLEYYDEVEVSQTASSGHFKASMQSRNKEMVDRANLIMLCVEHGSDGAYQTLIYAQKKEMSYINISYRLMEK